MKKVFILGVSLFLLACTMQAQEEKIELVINKNGVMFTEAPPQKTELLEATTLTIRPEDIPSNCNRIAQVENSTGEKTWQCQTLVNGKYIPSTESSVSPLTPQKRTIVVWLYGDDMFQNQKLIDGVWTNVGAPF